MCFLRELLLVVCWIAKIVIHSTPELSSYKDEQDEFIKQRVQGAEICSSMTTKNALYEELYMREPVICTPYLLLQDSYIYMQIILYIKIYHGRCIGLLTSITSKMVWIHLMYAPLTYFVVFLGSMGTGEDLFYKCYAHSGELSTHSNTHKKFLIEIWTMSISFLKKNNITTFTDWLIYTSIPNKQVICS